MSKNLTDPKSHNGMFKNIKNKLSFRSFFHKNKNYEFSPKRDWAVLVTLFFLANIILLVLLVANYFKIANEIGSNGISSFEKIDSVDLESVELVLKEIDGKKLKLQTLIEEGITTTDPSI